MRIINQSISYRRCLAGTDVSQHPHSCTAEHREDYSNANTFSMLDILNPRLLDHGESPQIEWEWQTTWAPTLSRVGDSHRTEERPKASTR